MTVAQLRDHYHTTFGEPTASRHKTWLVRRIAWRLQADDEGGLSERTLRRAAELAQDSEIRVTAPRESGEAGHRSRGDSWRLRGRPNRLRHDTERLAKRMGAEDQVRAGRR